MKFRFAILAAFGICISVITLQSATDIIETKTAADIVAEKKKNLVWCSPNYLPDADDDIPLLSGWGNYRWNITTGSDSARLYFNQGINLYYAFHIIESRASFDKATRLDPSCAMAWWGKALAFGPNINDFSYEPPSEAYPSVQKAIELKAGVSTMEKALIEAIAVRYSPDKSADQALLNGKYRDAMRSVFDAYSGDDNISTLFADALMLIHPWDLYNHDFTPKPWTAEIVKVLKHALKLNPRHPGANHLFIHAVEGSDNPGVALPSAEFLSTAMPNVSHITHMPSHVYIRTGFYEKGIKVNDDGVNGYYQYQRHFSATEENIALYLLHNIHMKLSCAQMAGNYKIAINSAEELQKKIPDSYLQIPGALGHYIQYLHQSTLSTWVRFGKWEEILREPAVDSLEYTALLQHFARGMALAKTQKIATAKKELEALSAKMNDSSLKEALAPFNSAYHAALVARGILAGTISEQENLYDEAVALYQQAVIDEDRLIYNEPRDWLLPARQYLGNVLIKKSAYKKAIEVLKKDLQINPNNGWSLTGLEVCYKKLNKTAELKSLQKQLRSAWSILDTPAPDQATVY